MTASYIAIEEIPQISLGADAQAGFAYMDLKTLQAIGQATDHNPFQPHRLDFFALLLLESGQVEHTVDFQKFELEAGDAVLIAKGQIHAFDPTHAYDGKLIVFSEAFLHTHFTPDSIAKVDRLYNYFAASPKISQATWTQELIGNLAKLETGEKPRFEANLVGALLTIFFLRIASKQHQQDPVFDRSYELFLRFKKRVEQQYQQTRDVKEYVVGLGVSNRALNAATQQIVNKSAKEFIDDFVIVEAKRQLIARTLTTKEIAFECGFDELTNFSKFFKKHTGKTPTEFRQSLS